MAYTGGARRGRRWGWLLDALLVAGGIAMLAYGSGLAMRQHGEPVMGTFSHCTEPVSQRDPLTRQVETHRTCDVAWQDGGRGHTARIDIGGAGRGDGQVPLVVDGDRAAAQSRSTSGSSFILIGLLMLGAVALDLVRRGVRRWQRGP